LRGLDYTISLRRYCTVIKLAGRQHTQSLKNKLKEMCFKTGYIITELSELDYQRMVNLDEEYLKKVERLWRS
jgi:hypothetical protein